MATVDAIDTPEQPPQADAEPAEKPRRRQVVRKRGPTGKPHTALIHGLALGGLPAGCGWVTLYTRKLRQNLEAAVTANGGTLEIYHRGVIQTAVRWERHALLCTRWLRVNYEKIGHDTRLAYSRDVAKASGERDRCLRALGLDGSGESDVLTLLASARGAALDEAPADDMNDAPNEDAQTAACGDAMAEAIQNTNGHENAGEAVGAGAVQSPSK